MLWTSLQYIFCSLADLIRNLSLSTTEGTYTFSDGTSFTLTGGTIGTSDATWSTDFTAWKDGQPKDDVDKQEKQDCVKVLSPHILSTYMQSLLKGFASLMHQHHLRW